MRLRGAFSMCYLGSGLPLLAIVIILVVVNLFYYNFYGLKTHRQAKTKTHIGLLRFPPGLHKSQDISLLAFGAERF